MALHLPDFDESYMSVRFAGETLDTTGVSIYDLANTLLAIQRMVHKAHLAQIEGRLKKGSYPNKEERELLALQIGARKHGSDVFGLVPIITDPTNLNYMRDLTTFVLDCVASYWTGNILDRLKTENNPSKRIFIGSIHAEVVNIVDRIDASGGVESISIGAPKLGHETIASFTSETKEKLRALKDETFLGEYQDIFGVPYKFYPDSKIVTIHQLGSGPTVSVFLKDENFDTLRYSKLKKPLYKFSGRPVHRFGIETNTVDEFEADAIEYIPPESLR